MCSNSYLSSDEANGVYLRRLSKLYCSLVLNTHLGLSTAISFLAKLAAVKMPPGHIVVRNKDPPASALIVDTNGFKRFVVESVKLLSPLICSMG